MKKFLIAVLLSGFSFLIHAQNVAPSQNDTANFPYWIRMMQDPGTNFYQTQRAFDIYWKDRKIVRSHGWKVFKRWEYMTRSRILPNGSLPSPSSTYDTYMTYARNSRSSSGNWTSFGPSQVPNTPGYEGLGRINVVAFHPTDPDKLFIGAPSGGMWQTADGGQNWSTNTDNLPTLGVSAIVVDKDNPSTIFIGTGDRDAGDAPGLGVFKSTDGGLTWTQWNTGMGTRTVGRLIQHPTNGQILLAACSGGVYRTTDGGATWTQSVVGDFKDVCFKPNDPSIVYAASGADFYRSTNNGLSFVKITSGLSSGQRGVIAVTAANPNYVYFLQSDNSSGFQGLYRSTDAGLNFTTRSTTPNILDWSCDGSGTGGQGWYDLALAASPTMAEVIFVGGVDVWKSIDGGATWTISSHWYGGCNVPAVHADCHFLTYSPVNGKLFQCNDGGIYSTNDAGATWTDHTATITIGQIYKLGQAQTIKDKVINGFQDNGSYIWAGTNWLAAGGGDGMECAIDPSDGAYTYHTIYYGDIYRKYNNNNEKHIAGNGVYGITESGNWVTPFTLSENNPRVMFVGYKNIWRCLNVKTSNLIWTKISDNLAGSNSTDMAVVEHSPADSNLLYAARYDSRLFRCDNVMADDPQWVDLTSYMPAGGTPTDIEAHPSDPDIVYITLENHVYKSIDKGQSWTDITGSLPNIHISTIAYYKNALEGLYVGTDAGVYYKDQSLSDWIPFSQGLPANGRVTELEIYYDPADVANDAIRASTYGRGLWGSDMYLGTPDADFTADKTLIPSGCSVNFTDLSNGVPTSWVWTFDGATPATSTEKNPSNITYSTPGTYQVKMVVSNVNGSDSIVKTNYITVSGTLLPDVNFTADKNALCTGDLVHFTDQTGNCPSSWHWEFTPNSVVFVEGTTPSSQNPIVQFNQNGNYDVKLTATNGVGSNSITKTSYILNGGYTLPFESDFTNGFGGQFWEVENSDQGITWDTISVPGTLNGGPAVWINYYNYITVGRRDLLISPAMDFTNFSSVALTFRHSYAQRIPVKDSIVVRISDDCGTTWTRIFEAGPDGTPNTFVTHEPTNDEFFPGSSNDWCGGSYGVGCYTIDLTPYAGKNNIKIKFESYNRRGNNLFLDNISVTGLVGTQEISGQGNTMKVYPNPAKDAVTLEVTAPLTGAKLVLVNLQGSIVLDQPLPDTKGSMKKTIDLGDLAPGVYILRVVSDGFTGVEKLILE